MAFRYQRNARRRAEVAAVMSVCAVVVFGPFAAVPSVAFVALVYYVHHLVAVLVGDDRVPYPSLAFVIVANAAVVLLVQALVLLEAFTRTV